MATSINATPRAVLNGLQDKSRRPPVPVPQQIPQHLPYIYTLAERGPTDPQLVDSIARNTIYGAATWDQTSPFATHQTVIANTMNARGNTQLVQRLKPTGANTAILRISAELIPTNIPIYARNPMDGSIQYNTQTPQQIANGIPPTPTISETIVGSRVVLYSTVDIYGPAQQGFGLGQVQAGSALSVVGGVAVSPAPAGFRAGTVTSSDGTLTPLGVVSYGTASPKLTITPTSTLFPLFDLNVGSFGSYGNGIGLRMQAPTVDDAIPEDTATMEALRAYIYRFYCVENSVATGTPNVLATQLGDLYVDACLKPNLINPNTGAQISMQDTFINAYQTLGNPNLPNVYGSFGDLHVYQANLDTLLSYLTQGYSISDPVAGIIPVIGEGAYDTDALAFGRTPALAFTGTTANNYMFNPFTGVDQNNVPYYTLDVHNSVYFAGTSMVGNSIQYAVGGSDGLAVDASGHPDKLANWGMYDLMVQDAALNFATGPYPLMDAARYPMSAFWDSGFSLNTKKALLTPMGARKDLFTFLSTQSIIEPIYSTTAGPTLGTVTGWALRPQNSASDELAIAIALRTAASAFPESDVFGTSVCRTAIIGRSGTLLNSNWTTLLPLTIDVADKVANYMGASNGKWKNGLGFDEEGGNIVTMFRDVNLTWQPDAAYTQSWANGLVWVQSFDMKQLFYPAFKSVYNDDTSVLNSLITVLACCYLEKVAQLAWRSLTGNTKLSQAQFIERSNAIIAAAVKDVFDDRYTIVPDTFYTAADNQRGYTWSCNINIYANVEETVGTYTIVANRLSDLTPTSGASA